MKFNGDMLQNININTKYKYNSRNINTNIVNESRKPTFLIFFYSSQQFLIYSFLNYNTTVTVCTCNNSLFKIQNSNSPHISNLLTFCILWVFSKQCVDFNGFGQNFFIHNIYSKKYMYWFQNIVQRNLQCKCQLACVSYS